MESMRIGLGALHQLRYRFERLRFCGVQIPGRVLRKFLPCFHVFSVGFVSGITRPINERTELQQKVRIWSLLKFKGAMGSI